MSGAKVQYPELMASLTDVFRAHGFEGASLSLLSEATGLKRASLYHRFPGGKEEMAEAVLETTNNWVGKYIVEPLAGPGKPATKFKTMITGIDVFYEGGKKACLFDSLSFVEDGTDIREKVELGVSGLIEGIEGVVKEAGFETVEAHRRAEDAVIKIQGALVLARALNDTAPFKRTLEALPKELLGEVA